MNNLYLRVLNSSGQLLKDGNVFRTFRTKNQKIVNQTITPNGSFSTIVISNNNVVEKIINKGVISDSASTIDTWDYLKSIGYNRSIAVTKKGMAFLQRVFKKVSDKYVDPNGVMALYSKGSNKPLSSCNVKLFGSTTIPTSGDIWINSKFYEFFK